MCVASRGGLYKVPLSGGIEAETDRENHPLPVPHEHWLPFPQPAGKLATSVNRLPVTLPYIPQFCYKTEKTFHFPLSCPFVS